MCVSRSRSVSCPSDTIAERRPAGPSAEGCPLRAGAAGASGVARAGRTVRLWRAARTRIGVWAEAGAARAVRVQAAVRTIRTTRSAHPAHAGPRSALCVLFTNCPIRHRPAALARSRIAERRGRAFEAAERRRCALEIAQARRSVRSHRPARLGSFIAEFTRGARSGAATNRPAGLRLQDAIRAFAEYVLAVARFADLASAVRHFVTGGPEVVRGVVEHRRARGRGQLVKAPARRPSVVRDPPLDDQVDHARSDVSLHRPALSIVLVEGLHPLDCIATPGDLRADNRRILRRPEGHRHRRRIARIGGETGSASDRHPEQRHDA